MRQSITIILLITICLGLSLSAAAETAAITPTHLRCEYRENPLGIDVAVPRLSWWLESDARGQSQSAYQILVASTPELLAENTGDLWDTKKWPSPQSNQIEYAGQPLSYGMQAYWKVRVWDAQDRPSAWSDTALWTMGPMAARDWQAQWIGMNPEDGDPDFPWLRGMAQLDAPVKQAFAHVNVLGYYELYINGQRVDDHVLSPAVSQLSERSYYITHDVSTYLRPGKNVIALWLGHGWYSPKMPWTQHEGPVVRAQIDCVLEDGRDAQLITDASWKAHESMIAQVGKWMDQGGYGGEDYDARKENDAWNAMDFDDSTWKQVVLCDIRDHLAAAQPVEPNRIIETITPVSIKELEPDVYLVDFGRNLSGWLEVELPSVTTAGQKVSFRYNDHLCDDSCKDYAFKHFNQRDEYTARDGDGQRFQNRMNYHAFQYLHITGLTEAPKLENFKAHLIHTDYDITSSFACSSERLTKIHDMIAYTLRCLSQGGYIVDCAHRERLGYGGDGNSSTETALTMFGMGPMYTAWLDHWADSQRPNGDMPHTAPNPCNAGGGPYWCGFIIHAAWEMYLQEGDQRILEKHYDTMRRWLYFVEAHKKDGLLRPWPNMPYRNWYLGDWAVPEGIEQKDPESIDLVNNCFIISCYDRMMDIANRIGRWEDAMAFRAKANAMRPLVHAEFFNEATGTYADGDQIDMAYPLLTDIMPINFAEVGLEGKVLDKLVHNILVEREGRHSVGLVGVPILYRALAKYGRDDVVMAYTDHDRNPGYGYMLAQGASTVWEYWDKCNSNIHNCYNGFGAWFYRSVAGIKPDPLSPGYRRVIIYPQLIPGLTWAKATQITPYGPVKVHWQRKGKGLAIDINIPAGSTARVTLPASENAVITEGGQPVDALKGIRNNHHISKDRYSFEIPSGNYSFQIKE